jgi:DNA-binding CsgD family transcriptional regulator
LWGSSAGHRPMGMDHSPHGVGDFLDMEFRHPGPSRLAQRRISTVVTALRKVDLIFCEGKPPNWLNSWALTSLVVSTARSKCIRPASDWRVRIRHSARRGLTDREVTIRFHSRMHLPWIYSIVGCKTALQIVKEAGSSGTGVGLLPRRRTLPYRNAPKSSVCPSAGVPTSISLVSPPSDGGRKMDAQLGCAVDHHEASNKARFTRQ